MTEIPPAARVLEDMRIPHEIFRHAGAVTTLEQAARERGQRPEQVVRSIVFRLSQDSFLMVLAAGPSPISWKKLRGHVGQSRLTLATQEEVLQVTGYRIGTVSPFGLRSPLRILMDQHVLRETYVSIGSGAARIGIILRSDDILRAIPAVEVVDLAAQS